MANTSAAKVTLEVLNGGSVGGPNAAKIAAEVLQGATNVAESAAKVQAEVLSGGFNTRVANGKSHLGVLSGGYGTRVGVGTLRLNILYAPAPEPPPPDTTGPDPIILPPEDCAQQSDGCCVPDLNRVIEARLGPLNNIEDLRKGMWYLQDRYNVLVREFNKLATVTRPDPPSV